MKTTVVLINLGTPDSPSVGDVRSYLSQFLNDPRVVDLPWLVRKILVNLIIVPFRAPKSAKIYQKLWTDRGSPIIYHGERVQQLLQEKLGPEYTVELAMRYKNPSIPDVLERVRKANPDRIVVLPLFPQYASASTGSALQEVMDQVREWWVIPEIQFISQYWDHPLFVKALVERGKQYDWREYDHVLFSYHGLPERQVDKVYNSGLCQDRDCEHEVTDENKYCYKAACYGTTRLLAAGLGIPEENYTVCFQSRLDKKWLEPFSDKVVVEQAEKGAKNLLVFSPAFVADCLETTIEISDEYQELFEQHGGEQVRLVESLNDQPAWIDALEALVKPIR
ncbi:MAG: ferrochelatase [Xanthomonadales bacterium]|nr:ferrochelatase [Gammaproteobacteria bacterium]MBT8053408.1 ferrochelatase [Gammaproteobacteria bacterium]NNK52093.1 ferrochelatase [Xanthomonadales bacterium]